jgi:hypothetical protein
MNTYNNAPKPPATLMLRPTTKQREEAQQQEKARRMMSNGNEDASRPLMTMTMRMTTMMMLCQSLPFFIGFFIVWLIGMGQSFFGRKI